MDRRTFPVLTDADEPLITRLAAGLGEDAGRVLAYLLCRIREADLDRTATLTAIHIGTSLSQNAARTSLDRLEKRGFVERTTVQTSSPGRPPNAWYAVDALATTARGVADEHAGRLLRQAAQFDDNENGTPISSDSSGDRSQLAILSDPATRSDHDRRDETEQPIRVALNWHPNGFHGALFGPIAAATDDEPGTTDRPIESEPEPEPKLEPETKSELEFEYHACAGSSAAVQTVVDDEETDLAVAGAATVLCERAAGRDVVPVAVLLPRSPVVLYTTQSAFGEPFERLDQLRGRRLGMPPASETGLLGQLLLSQAGIRDAVDIIELDGEERTALESGEVDAVTGVAADATRLERDGATVDVISIAEQYPVYGPALVASREGLTDPETRARIWAFLVAMTASWGLVQCSPSSVATVIADRAMSGEAVDEVQSRDRIERTLRLATAQFARSDGVRKHGWGWHTPDDWQRLCAALVQGGVLDSRCA
ncbi:hypothetical protein C482_06327 [Natrialba chahannaoensis JCM 10990]|uniref:SsuA/THI5-like domain-containing protein n=1 Tax=Natrialba chahannaoensis JCM 10990 TaxID=1227492 RepID=M0ASG8_9EURY|nr:ABC transporter substrate-binding protein [Natrialba chahannaoensis]ELZ01646.1 hypothetical protein C482_06327 [Natrialba chahannaoensis JCM 10990]